MSDSTPESPPNPPPTLNWLEREGGLSGQLPLPGLADMPTPAERVFVQLAGQWRKGFAGKIERNPPRAVDEIALAAVLLAREHGSSFTKVALQQAEANIVLTEVPYVSWLDRLPWRLAVCAMMFEPRASREIRELECNLNHHNSGVRIWVMELAWMVRPLLNREAALPLLLENVATSLIGVEMAWGLAGSMFDSIEQFYPAAEIWQPKDESFAEQYARRVAELKKEWLPETQASFWFTESRCRRLIAESAMSP